MLHKVGSFRFFAGIKVCVEYVQPDSIALSEGISVSSIETVSLLTRVLQQSVCVCVSVSGKEGYPRRVQPELPCYRVSLRTDPDNSFFLHDGTGTAPTTATPGFILSPC